MDRRKFLTGVAGGAAAAEVGIKVFSVFDVHGKDRLMELLTVNANHRPHCEIEVLSTSKQGHQTGEWRGQKQLYLDREKLTYVELLRCFVTFHDLFGKHPKRLTITKWDLAHAESLPFVQEYSQRFEKLGFKPVLALYGSTDNLRRSIVQDAANLGVYVDVLDVPHCSIVRLCG